jgi:hypothetical protein
MFRDVSALIESNHPALHYGITVTDFEGDGVFEFVVAGFGCANRVLKWKEERLCDVTPPVLADPEQQSIGLAAGDIDGDGQEELYILNCDSFAGPTGNADRLFDVRPGGRWIDLFRRPPNRTHRNLAAGRSVAVLDRRGTGRYGFFVASSGHPMRLFEQNSDGSLIDLAPSLDLDYTTGGRALWAGPLLSERTDLFCVNEHGPNFLFRNCGNGTFDEVAVEFQLADPDEDGRGVVALDADGDGRLDLCWGNWDGPHRLMVRHVDGTYRDRASPALAMPGPVRTVIAADFDNDGWEELYFNNLGEPNRLFAAAAGRGDAASRLPGWVMLDPGPAAEPNGLGTGAAVADVDGDGVLELLIAHGESTPQSLTLFKVPTDNARHRRRQRVSLPDGARRPLRPGNAGNGEVGHCDMAGWSPADDRKPRCPANASGAIPPVVE